LKTKKCTKCGETKSTVEFSPHKRTRDGLDSWCRNCKNVATKKYRIEHPHLQWATDTVHNHKKRGFKVHFTIAQLTAIAKVTKRCYICHRELDFSWGTKGKKIVKGSPTLDRINNETDVTLDNIAILCHRCNGAKHTMTMDEFIDYCKRVAYIFSERI